VAHSRVLVLGSGGREHALALRLREDPEASEVMLAPGHEGAARTFRCLAVSDRDASRLIEVCRSERVDLVVVGPEAPLAAGVVDALEAAGVRTFGPHREAARLESSKWFAKQVMLEAGIPTARAERHDSAPAARAALGRFAPPWVIKADGLAAGKGVCVTRDAEAAAAFLGECLEGGRFGDSGRAVVIEEFLSGEEASVMAVCDGTRHVLLTPARDFKRAFDGEEGPNTGGMGAFAPAPGVHQATERTVSERIVTPLLQRMAARGAPFCGLLYCGLMLNAAGEPRVVEFNVRFGDPETQVVLPLTAGSFYRLLESAAAGKLDVGAVRRAPGAAVAVALVERGYPGAAEGGGPITGLDGVESEDVRVVHAATRREGGEWVTRGGRAAYVVARGAGVTEARTRAYQAIDRLSGSGWRCRRDIAAGARDEPRSDSGAPAAARKG
jgi:phosphoribosylamine--glycine ligase